MTFDLILGEYQFGLLGFDAPLLFMEVLLFASSLFLMLLVLVQRGKGGGLTGALGGMGGQSAFGSKAGDAFTKITIITAVIWITLCMITIAAFNPPPPPKSLTQQLQTQSGSVTGAADDENADEENADANPETGSDGQADLGASTSSRESGDSAVDTDPTESAVLDATPAADATGDGDSGADGTDNVELDLGGPGTVDE